jgi:hypothetical protein
MAVTGVHIPTKVRKVIGLPSKLEIMKGIE